LPTTASVDFHIAVYRASLLGAFPGGIAYLSNTHIGVRTIGKMLEPFVANFGLRKMHLYDSFTSAKGPQETSGQHHAHIEAEWFQLDCLRRWLAEESRSIDEVSSRAGGGQRPIVALHRLLTWISPAASRMFLQLGPHGFLKAILDPNEQQTPSLLDHRIRWDDDMGRLLQGIQRINTSVIRLWLLSNVIIHRLQSNFPLAAS